MCGIVGYTGPRAAGPVLLDGLRRLEYRGYDSAGIALVTDDGDLFVEKRAGKAAGPLTDGRAISTLILTATARVASPWCTTA